MIKETLNYIKEQTGLNLTTCDYFTEIGELNGKKYFNVVLNKNTSESEEYNTLEKFANKYKTIKIEPNGVKRVAIFTNN